MKVKRTLRLPEKEYYQAKHPKDLIVLHHTVGGSARSTFNWWLTDPKHIATAYLLERDGTVYEVFPPECWAFHLGIKGSKGAADKRSIGIEICSEGGLLERGGKFYCFDRVSERTRFTGKIFDNKNTWRGYQYLADYTSKQRKVVPELVNYLIDRFPTIPRRVPRDSRGFSPKWVRFKGVIGHSHVRRDKSDVHLGVGWHNLVRESSLVQV